MQNEGCGHPGWDELASYWATWCQGVQWSQDVWDIYDRMDGIFSANNRILGHRGCSKRPPYEVQDRGNSKFYASHNFDGIVNVDDKECGS